MALLTHVLSPGQQKRREVFQKMARYMNATIISEAHRCADRLIAAFSHPRLSDNRVFVAFGGGKDSSYMVSFVRFIQLLISQQHQETFQLRIVTNRHSGMPSSVMENIHRVYTNLGLYDDPAAELLLVDGQEVSPFHVHRTLPELVIERNRLDILMTGHRCGGEARPTFCNACNLSMINSFGVAASYGDGIDIIVTGDSSRELLLYLAWVRHIASRLGIPQPRRATGFHTFLQTVDDVAQYYFSDIHGAVAREEVEKRRITRAKTEREPRLFSIYYDTDYQVANHWELLTDFLLFQFDEIAFSFTESDCTNPALMAHLRGLKAEHVYGRTYEEGIREYLQFALHLMQQKDFPEQLIAVMQARYDTSEAVQIMREKLDRYAHETLDLTEAQLVCMLYSPFVQQGKDLAFYIEREQSELSPWTASIHALLSGKAECLSAQERAFLEEHLVRMAHLDVDRLRVLYAMDIALHKEKKVRTPISLILERDPHKAVIRTSHSSDGLPVEDIISGR